MDAEVFRAMKEAKREKRRNRLAVANAEMHLYVEACREHYELVVCSDYQWNFRRRSDGSVACSYWPSASKWMTLPDRKIRTGSPEQFRKLLREGRL